MALWLAEDVDGISVYTMAYEAPASNWLGTSMPLQDRAVNVLEVLLSEPGLKSGPIAFICHSLGGLIVKLGSKLIDASVKNKLARLERQLKSQSLNIVKGAA